MSVFNFGNHLSHRNNTCHKTSITIGVRSGPDFIRIAPLMGSSFMMPVKSVFIQLFEVIIWDSALKLIILDTEIYPKAVI